MRDRREEWNALAREAGGDAFNTFEWCELWWRHFGAGRRLRIYWLERLGRPVAIVPLFYERIHFWPVQLGIAKLVGSDHTNTTCSPIVLDNEIEPAVEFVVRDLVRKHEVDVVHLGELPGYWPHGRALAKALAAALPGYQVVRDDRYYPQMLIPVPRDYETFLSSLSHQERHNIRHAQRQLEREGEVTEREPANEQELQAALPRLIDMH